MADPATTIAAAEVKEEIVKRLKELITSPSFWTILGVGKDENVCKIKCPQCKTIAMMSVHVMYIVPKFAARLNCKACGKELHRTGVYKGSEGAKEHVMREFALIYASEVQAMDDAEAKVYLEILKSAGK